MEVEGILYETYNHDKYYLVNDCQFGVSPVNNSDSDSDLQ